MPVLTLPRMLHPLWRMIALLIVLNAIAWGLLENLGRFDPTLLGIGMLAYGFGLRHAFDADHIAAIDNVTRKLCQAGQRPLGIGLFFSLGHSTVVFGLSTLLVTAIHTTQTHLPLLQHWGGVVGTLISATFLTLIGLINLVIFLRLWRIYRPRDRRTAPAPNDSDLETLLQRRGLLASVLRGFYRHIDQSWKMYPVGLLFGLGFDTASEIAILGISAATAHNSHLPLWDMMVFPLLFTAAMSLMDTLDGIVMLHAYDWAMADAHRKLTFNTTLTGMSVLLALSVGLIEWMQVIAPSWGLPPDQWETLKRLNFSQAGLAATLIMLSGWLFAFIYYRRFLTTTET